MGRTLTVNMEEHCWWDFQFLVVVNSTLLVLMGENIETIFNCLFFAKECS